MTATSPRVVVPERGTGLRRSAVIADPRGGFVWLRRAGSLAPAGLPVPAPATAQALEAIRTPTGSGWRTATRAGDWLGYPMPAARSVWEELVTGVLTPEDPAVETAFEECGRLLRALHELPPPGGDRPPSLARLENWLTAAGPEPEPAARARRLLVEAIGDDGWQRLREWVRDLARPAGLVHGWFGLGHVARGDGAVQACVGEDAGAAEPALDVGFLLGQLRELEAFGTAGPALRERLRSALAAGYGELPPRSDHAAAVQLALHVHDFTHYFGVVEDELPTWAGLVAAAVEQARGTER